MELRKVERELEDLSSEWKALRRKRPRFDDVVRANECGTTAAGDDVGTSGEGAEASPLSVRMPSWRELESRVKDEEIFPPEEEEEEEEKEYDGDARTEDSAASDHVGGNAAAANGDDGADDANAAGGYSEFGMCLANNAGGGAKGSGEGEGSSSTTTTNGAGNGGSVWERYAARTTTTAAKTNAADLAAPEKKEERAPRPADADKDEDDGYEISEGAPAGEVLAGLESLQERFEALAPKIEKFLTKLKDRDPVTKKPRYGEKTMSRVKNAVRTYKALEWGVAAAFLDADAGPGVISSLRSQIQQHSERLHAQTKAEQSQQQLEEERIAEEKRLAEERANRQKILEEQRKQEEERELARRAEEARLRRVEEERRALEAERRADRELLDLVPNLGAEGVREQIGRMREALKDDRAALDVALGSLYTLFEQIVRKPEEINFRRVRRDHPKFVEDIGRHVGGREVLIAAGFRLEKLDGVPCFFSREPHIESDMDGWSDWFDTLKKTLEVVEEELLK